MFDFAYLIPLMALAIPIFAIWSKHQRRMAELQVQATAEKAAQYASHSRELEERVRVLERIITDQGYDTALQIEALRDRREVDGQRTADRDKAIN
ncbi:hypothetical protein [Novosphingobium mangrovi (ex Huang et al. 2023)]|uniref:Phage shock protein B n=1 Tax=Novosphingobium mangrovi (ex Huang et al. 2023) TaxID=2976432 RepID=A0ABT2I229_9SPHN|nr:hypothetical protein [Novosphingobium mangrovi (ex Huang et al. 2023)]MCT2398853.1 hypothetical protein [Novosphingobium mangrovi (ex Huang et al. 2023)]